ncbi:MAG: WG repeat-containing protein [Chitinophagaceae bacterium]|nr:WG repeat-containing protein [Chitinophagaceae bacterium]
MRNLIVFLFYGLCTLQSSAQLTPYKDDKGKYGYKDEKGAIIIPAQYDLALPESEYFLPVNKGYKEVIENGAPKVITWGKWGFLNSKGQQLIPFKYDMVKPVTNGHFVVNTGAKPWGTEWLTGGKWGSIDLLQKALFPMKYDMIREAAGGKWLVNTGGKFYFNANGVLPDKNQPGKWGIAGNDGKEIVKPAYTSLQLAWENNFIAQDPVSKKYGLLSYDGKLKIPFEYEQLNDFSLGAALAKKNGKYGFIGTQNQIIVPLVYDDIYEKDLYAAGYVLVKKDGRTFSIDASGREAVQSPEPYESNYQKAIASAGETKDRVAALNAYFRGIRSLSFTDDQLKFLLDGKFRQLFETDFYALYEFYLDQVSVKDDKRAFTTTYLALKKLLTKEQFDIFDFYTQHAMGEKGIQVYNQTTGVTTISPKLAWRADAPRPGYGWGKLVSSDKPKVSTTPAYTQTSSKPSEYIPSEAQALVGHGYYKDTSFINTWGDFHAVTKICHVQSISGEFANVLYFLSNSNTVQNGRIPWKEFTQYNSAYKPLQKWYSTCGVCNGSGTVQASSTYSHTNDYEYTLGVKQTITSTTYKNVSCNKCGGCGLSASDGSGYEWRTPYYSPKKKR